MTEGLQVITAVSASRFLFVSRFDQLFGRKLAQQPLNFVSLRPHGD
jgi:hypothetical protein